MSFETATKILTVALIPLCGACSAGAEGFDEADSFDTAAAYDPLAAAYDPLAAAYDPLAVVEDPFAEGEEASAEGEEFLAEKSTTVVWQTSNKRAYLSNTGWQKITSKRNARSNSTNNLWGVGETDSQTKVAARLKVLYDNSTFQRAWTASGKIYALRKFNGIGSTQNIGIDGSGNRSNKMLMVLKKSTSGGLVDFEIVDSYTVSSSL